MKKLQIDGIMRNFMKTSNTRPSIFVSCADFVDT